MNEFVGFQNQDYKIEIVNYLLKRRLELPNIYPDIQFVGHFPAISESGIYYSYLSKGSIALVIADLQEKIQTVIWEGELDSSIPAWAPRLDAYDERLVSEGGEDCSSGKCFRQPPWPAKGVDVYECAFGLSIWGDRLVCMTLNNPPDDILAYDLTTMWTFPITDDNYYQIWPRIHEDRVVWQDFRLGSGVPTGSWEHSAIFAKDLSTGDVKQITDGSAIASFPDVHGDRIVWTDYRHCGNPHDKNDFANVEVYGYNLATQTEFRVTNLPGRPKSIPRVWGEKAFVEMRTMGGGTAVYMFDLPPEAY
jgi:beta propeller repeat protein